MDAQQTQEQEGQVTLTVFGSARSVRRAALELFEASSTVTINRTTRPVAEIETGYDAVASELPAKAPKAAKSTKRTDQTKGAGAAPPAADVAAPPVAAAPAPVAKPEPVKAESKAVDNDAPTGSEVSKAVMDFARAKGMAPAGALLKQFGVQRASDLKTDQYAAVLAEIAKQS